MLQSRVFSAMFDAVDQIAYQTKHPEVSGSLNSLNFTQLISCEASPNRKQLPTWRVHWFPASPRRSLAVPQGHRVVADLGWRRSWVLWSLWQLEIPAGAVGLPRRFQSTRITRTPHVPQSLLRLKSNQLSDSIGKVGSNDHLETAATLGVW